MVNQQTLKGNWNEIKGKLRSKWGQLTNDDVQTFNGNVDQLIGMIQRKTGEARDSIEKFLDSTTAEGSSFISAASENVREYAQHAAEAIQDTSKKAAESVQKGYHDAEEMVRARPAESAAICFGAGVLVGLLVGVLARR